MILIKNAQVFAPKALGKKDVLLAYDKILEKYYPGTVLKKINL